MSAHDRLFGLLLLALLLTLAIASATQDFYQTLGLSRSASDKDIKSAYRQLSKKFHPDKNPGDPTAHDKFVQVSEAYETLIDKETRSIYDQHGHEGLERHKRGGHSGGGGGSHDPFDLFSRFFGGGGHFSGQQRQGSDIHLKVAMGLRDFYHGLDTEIQWEKQHVCDQCSGTGSADGVVETCRVCQGHGVRVVKQQIAPGMFQQHHIACEACGQRGKTVRKACPVCQGKRVVRKSTPVPLKVIRGAPVGSKLIYENEADAHPDYVAGNLVITLVEKPPPTMDTAEAEKKKRSQGQKVTADNDDNPDRVDGVFFRRRDNDLFWKEVLGLREAWLGDWSRNLTHLDGHVVRLGRPAGETIQPGHVEKIVGEGMPIWAEDGDDVYHKTQYGDLYVEYTVLLPDQIDKDMRQDFQQVWDKYLDRRVDLGSFRKQHTEHTHDEL